MDGTIFTSDIDWVLVKKRLNVTDTSLLEKIFGGDSIDRNALSYLEEIEETNTLNCKPIPGSLEFLREISSTGIKTALVTNNSRKNAEYLIDKYNLKFDMTISRDENMWKPSPSAFKFVMNKFNAKPENTISIGDSDLDISASIKSDISDVYIIQDSNIKYDYPIKIKYFADFQDLSSMILSS